MRYEFVALEADGREVQGVIDATSKREALQKLTRDGRIPVSAAPQRASGAGGRTDQRADGALRAKSLPDFTRRLAQMISSGVPVARALKTLATSSRDASAETLLASVKRGARLADALESHGAPFTPVYVALVRAGETSGRLSDALTDLARVLERERAAKSALTASLTYPALLAVVSVAVLLLLMVFVVPRFEALFADAGADLPMATQIVLKVAAILQATWQVPLILFVAAFAFLRWRRDDEALRRTIDGFLLRAPVIGSLTAEAVTARYCRSLGALLSGGAAAHDALRLANGAVENRVLRDRADAAHGRVKRGQSFSESFAAEGFGDAEFAEILTVGEASGDVGGALLTAAAIFDENLSRRLKAIVAMVEPIIILTLGVLIGAVVVSLFAAILSVNDLAF